MSKPQHRTPFGTVASTDWTAAVAALIRDMGVPRTCSHLGMNRCTVLAIAAGLPVLPGTLALVRERLRAARGAA